MVLTIFALWQVPARIRPLIETVPVNGHFLSIYVPSMASLGVLKPNPMLFQKRFPPFPGLFPFPVFLELKNTLGCLRNAFSVCSAMAEDWKDYPILCKDTAQKPSKTDQILKQIADGISNWRMTNWCLYFLQCSSFSLGTIIANRMKFAQQKAENIKNVPETMPKEMQSFVR